MAHIHAGLSQAEAFALYQTFPEHDKLMVFFAGNFIAELGEEERIYRATQPVCVLLDAADALYLPFFEEPHIDVAIRAVNGNSVEGETLVFGDGSEMRNLTWIFVEPEDDTLLDQLLDADEIDDLRLDARVYRQWSALYTTNFDDTVDALGFKPVGQDKIGGDASGLYALTFADGRHYVGQSVTLKQRLVTHRRVFGPFDTLHILPVSPVKETLNDLEQEAIDLLDRMGYPLLNVVHTSMTFRSSPLDDIVAPDIQRQWLDDPAILGMGTPAAVPEDLRAKTARNYSTYRKMPYADRITGVLRSFTQKTIPLPATLAPLYWSVSCMPSTNKSSGQRLACFSMSGMEVFVVGHHKGEPHNHWGFVNVSEDALRLTYETDEDITAAHSACDISFTGYQSAGHDQLALSVYSLDALEQLLRDPAVLFAARVLNLRLMGKQANVYRRFHCFNLADQLYQ